jgi:type IV secretion system protein VirD4
LLGQATEKRMQRSYSGSGLLLTHRSESEHEYGRALLTPAEISQLPGDDALLFVGGLLPYRARKVRYFLDPRLQDRAALRPPDTPEEQARELPARSPGDWETPAATPPEDPSPPPEPPADLPAPTAPGPVPTSPAADPASTDPTDPEAPFL